MSKSYFDYFPLVEYDMDKNKVPYLATNILHRFKIRDIVFSKSVIFYTYEIKEGERPDLVSDKFYGKPTLDWLVLITNQMLDRHYEWPLNYRDFVRFLKSKYGSIPASHQTVHHYELITQAETEQDNGVIIPERVVIIDQTKYLLTPDESRRSVSCYTYEKNLNEARRTIKIIHPSYVPQILNETDTIFNAG